MSVRFPPIPVYPKAIDSDYTLFKVHNTTEAQLTQDNQPWSEEVFIQPVSAASPEIWAENGFANIAGELFYYDDVEKDVNGKIYKLKHCARNLDGEQTRYNVAGTWVRGFVVAEYHTQLVNCINKIERFIGYEFTPDTTTLDWRIRNLQSTPVIYDDFSCPEVEFTFEILSENASSGTVASYNISITGNFTNFILQFGDGTSTTSSLSGTHTYAPNAKIDPVITITNSQCQIVQTPIERTESNQPQPQQPAEFDIPLPPDFSIPDINIQSFVPPSVDIAIPPIITPYPPTVDFAAIASLLSLPSMITVEGGFSLPSFIQFSPVSIPSIISVDVPSSISLNIASLPQMTLDIPSLPHFSIDVPSFPAIQFATPPTFPNIGFQTPPTFSNVGFQTPPTFSNVGFQTPPTFSNIGFQSPPTFPNIGFDTTNIPSTIELVSNFPSIIDCNCSFPSVISVSVPSIPAIQVQFPSPMPSININVTMNCPSSSSRAMAMGFGDYKGMAQDLEVEYDMVGFPSEIKITPPEFPNIRLKHKLPKSIALEVPEIAPISVIAPEIPDIRIIPPDIPTLISIVGPTIPETIMLDASAVPSSIPITMPIDMPRELKIDASDLPRSIPVTGIPETIQVIHNIPSEIIVKAQEPLPVVWQGEPPTVKIAFDVQKLIGEGQDVQCVYISPCPRRI